MTDEPLLSSPANQLHYLTNWKWFRVSTLSALWPTADASQILEYKQFTYVFLYFSCQLPMFALLMISFRLTCHFFIGVFLYLNRPIIIILALYLNYLPFLLLDSWHWHYLPFQHPRWIDSTVWRAFIGCRYIHDIETWKCHALTV